LFIRFYNCPGDKFKIFDDKSGVILPSNVYLTKFEPDRIDFFVENYKRFSRGNEKEQLNPSESIIDFLEQELQN